MMCGWSLLCSLITFIGYGAFYTYLTPYIVAFFPALEPAMSLILVMIGACSFLGNLLGGVACDRMGYRQALWVSSLLQIVISIVIFLTTAHLYLNLFFIFLWMFNGWFIGLQLNTESILSLIANPIYWFPSMVQLSSLPRP